MQSLPWKIRQNILSQTSRNVFDFLHVHKRIFSFRIVWLEVRRKVMTACEISSKQGATLEALNFHLYVLFVFPQAHTSSCTTSSIILIAIRRPSYQGRNSSTSWTRFSAKFRSQSARRSFFRSVKKASVALMFPTKLFFCCCCNISTSLYASVEDTKLARKANNEGKHKNGLSSGGDCYRLIYSRVSRALRHRDKLSHLTLRNFPFPEKKSEKKLQKFFNSIRSLRCQ